MSPTIGSSPGNGCHQIAPIDREILQLVNRRIGIARRIGELKSRDMNPDYYHPEREAQIIRRLLTLNSEARHLHEGVSRTLPDDEIVPLFREVVSITRGMESRLRVCVLGPRGTYTEAAARELLGSQISISDCLSMDDLFRSTESGKTDLSVVPIDNSTEGGVSRTLDHLIDTDLSICGEVYLQIHHALLSNEKRLKDVKHVYAHTQSLGQCRGWLGRNCSWARTVPVGSNATAALMAAEEPGTAAVAGEAAADHYDIDILCRNIEDKPGNTTRFLVLSDRLTPPSGDDKTSLIIASKNRPGALLDLLQIVSDCGIDMTKLESHPSRNRHGEYLFFIDVIGHRDDVPVMTALELLEREAAFLNVLGSYPRSV